MGRKKTNTPMNDRHFRCTDEFWESIPDPKSGYIRNAIMFYAMLDSMNFDFAEFEKNIIEHHKLNSVLKRVPEGLAE